MIHATRPIFSLQFHPEAKGGPQDSAYLFDSYLDSVTRYKNSQVTHAPGRENRPSPLLVDLLAKERVDVAPIKNLRAQAKAPAPGPGAATIPAHPAATGVEEAPGGIAVVA